MNKAFVREPDFDGANCPHCGGIGTPVKSGPLDTHLPDLIRRRLGDSAWYCDNERCECVFFDAFETSVQASELRGPVFPQDPQAPICPCFGFGMDEIEADLAEDAPVRIRALLEKSKSPAARCETLAVDGRCCMKHVQRIYMQMRQR